MTTENAQTFNASNASYEGRVDICEHVIANMAMRTSGNSTTGVLMAGDPGVGKTSFARFFSKLLGMTLITIEAPHITEEHVINIPFIVFDTISGRDKHGDQEVQVTDMNSYKLVLADSHLYGEMQRAHKVSDAELLKSIYSDSEDLIKVFEHFGGDKDTIPPQFVKLRSKFSVILFLDEFFRQSSVRIRNMLRGILNNKIGSHDMPPNVYVMYASNLATSKDATGIEPIPLNTDFTQLDFKSPDKDDWFAWLVSKYKSDKLDKKVALKPDIIEKFHKLLDQEDLNHHNADEEIRVSPRRWEQVILYVNSALPVKDEKEAKALMTNIRSNFKNYKTGAFTTDLVNKVMHAVAELIAETSGIHVNDGASLANSDWREALEHQIKVKMDLGEHRSYVPVISGLPGVGKTSKAGHIASDLDLRYIYIDCSTFDSEDISGIPLSQKKTDGSNGIELKFSFPKLFRQIMEDCKKADADYKAELKADGKTKEAAEYDDREWKYLIFFDEMNRTTMKVFNALRRVILEKNFGDGHELPKESVVIAAINPTDIGTIPLSGHMRDVVDVLDTAPSWKTTKSFLSKKLKFQDQIAPEMPEKVASVIEQMSEKFKTRDANIPVDEQNFHLDVTAGDSVYVSPREYVAMLSGAVELVNVKLHRLIPKLQATSDDGERRAIVKKISEQCKKAVFEKIKGILLNVQVKHNALSEPFFHELWNWIDSLDTLDFMVQEVETMSFNDIMTHYYDKPDDVNLSDEVEFNNYIDNVKDVNTFVADMREFLLNQVNDDIEKHVVTKSRPGKVLKDGQIEFEEKEVSKVEHFIREIIHALKIHNMSGEFSAGTKTALLEFLKSLGGHTKGRSELIKPLMTFNAGIQAFLKTLS